MASTSHPKILLFKQSGATGIAKGVAVKLAVDNKHVTPCSATTDAAIGISQGVSVNAEDFIEVALPGGGGKALAHTTITLGQLLVSHTDGSLKPTTAAGDRIIGVAMDSAVIGDLFYAEVVSAIAGGASE